MTSAITPGNINVDYPVAGQDNDSQGFRDNFSAIHDALAAAKLEIEDLQTKAVLTETLGNTAETVANNLNGSSIANGIYSQLNGAVPDDGLTTVSDGTNDIDLNAGPFQVFRIVGGDAVLRFKNWSTDVVQYSVVRVHLVSDGNERTVTLTTENGKDVVCETISDWAGSNQITINQDGLTHTVFEAWSYNGDVVFVRPLGDFLTPA